MRISNINRLVGLMTPEEVRDGLWRVGVFEDWGSMSRDEADEWTRRIDARRRFLDLPDTDSPA